MADVKRMRSPPTLARSRTFGRRHRHRTNASQDRPFQPVAMTHQAPAAVFGLQMFMRRQHGGNLRFNGLCQELASSGAEYCGQRIGRHPWMVQRDNTIFRHGVSLLA